MQSTYCTDTLHSQFTHEICQINFSAIVFCAKNLRRKRVTCEICYWGVVKRRNRLRLLLFSVMISHIGSGIKSQLAKRAIVSLFIFVNFHMMLQTTVPLELFATYLTFSNGSFFADMIAQLVVCLFIAPLFPILLELHTCGLSAPI